MKKAKANSYNFTPLLLLLIILAFIGVFLWQNFSPNIGLVFLGVRSQPLPLGLWLISGFFGGWVTAGLIYMIISLSALSKSKKIHRQEPLDYAEPIANNTASQGRSPSSYNDQHNDQYDNIYVNSSDKFATGAKTKIQNDQDFVNNTVNKKVVTPPPIDLNKSNNTVIQDNYSGKKQEPTVSPKANFSTVFPSVAPTVVSTLNDKNTNDDWLEKPKPIGDWERKDQSAQKVSSPPISNVETNNTNTEFEADQSPKSESWSGSVYSYGYREPENTGVGKTESIYDAEFRVIVPPAEASSSESSASVAEVDPAVSEYSEVTEKSETNDKLPDPPNFRNEQS
ncbi:MAG: hypothetical protein ACRC2J_08340 [Microcoleaceae cyanobacterium]